METSDELTVTKEDREAAAPLMRHYYANQDGSFVAKLFERDVLSGKYDDHFVVQAFARHRIAQTKADAARIAALEEALRELLATKRSTYKARNGRDVGIEADDGEMCWIVHSDQIFRLERALASSPEHNAAELEQTP